MLFVAECPLRECVASWARTSEFHIQGYVGVDGDAAD